MHHNDLLQARIKGAIIGVAYGDAMGMPTEFWTREQIKENFPHGITSFMKSTDQDFFHRQMQVGEVTDDTINTKMILDSLIYLHGDIHVEDYLKRLQLWAQDTSVSQYVCGPNTMKALEAIQKGVSIHESGKFGTTNGAAMKIVPIGFISNYQSMEDLVHRVEQICIPTHNTSIAIAGASIVAACISYGIQGGNDLTKLWEVAIAAYEVGKHRGHQLPCASLRHRLEHVRKICLKHPQEEVMDILYHFLGTGMETIETIPASLAIVLLSQGNPIVAAKLSAELGGDTDTIGAISTAICGSMNPYFTIEDIKLLESVNQIDFDKLAEEIAIYSPFYKV